MCEIWKRLVLLDLEWLPSDHCDRLRSKPVDGKDFCFSSLYIISARPVKVLKGEKGQGFPGTVTLDKCVSFCC